MQRTSFILGVALLVVASTLAITITFRKPANSEAQASDPDPSSRSRDHSSGYSSSRPPGDSWSRSQPAAAKSARRVPVPASFSVSVPDNHPQRTTLAGKAQKVESEARSELDRLTERLELTVEQRRRLFPILARTSKDYDPAMTISGLSAGAPALVGSAGNQELNKVLDPPQRDQLIEDAIADAALWQDIIDKLRRRLDEQTPEVPAAEPEPPQPAPATPRGRGNLFDTVEPQQ